MGRDTPSCPLYSQVLEMEFAVLKALRFACTVPTAKDFAGFFLAAEGAGEVVHSLTDV